MYLGDIVYMVVFQNYGGYVMINGTAKLVIDLGNSETRVKTLYGKTAKGNARSRVSILDNLYSSVSEEKAKAFIGSDIYSDEDSAIFRTESGLYYCNGELCRTEFASTGFRPSALEKKYESATTRLTLINALRRGIEDVAEINDVEASAIDVDWELYLLLPPEDIDVGAKPLAEMAKGITSIDFLMPEVKKNVRVTKVSVFPEGMCAFFGVIFKSKGVIRPEYKYLVEDNETTIIFDIGAGTTDIVIVKGSQVVQSSRFTKEIGGNNVHRLVQRSLRNKNIPLPDSVIREGVTTGYVKSGARQIDISEDIAEAKKAVSTQLVDGVQEFLESSMISIRTIANILVCGGGATESSNPAIKPISDYMVDYMRRLSPDLKLIELPVVSGADGEKERLSPRMLNIIGAGILAE